jgi:hypothetical protein
MRRTAILAGAILLVTAFCLLVLANLYTMATQAGEVPGIYTATPLPPAMRVTTPAKALVDQPPAAQNAAGAVLLSGDPPYKLGFEEMYSGRSVRYGLTMSDYLKALDGKQVSIEGYMAPPLKVALDFFVLTEVPMSLCPFCSSNADWPDNIILVYVNGQQVKPTTAPIRVTGRVEIGSKIDDQTGFISQVRIYADKMEILG